MLYHYESIKMAKIQNTDTTKYWEDREQQGLSFIAGQQISIWYSIGWYMTLYISQNL